MSVQTDAFEQRFEAAAASMLAAATRALWAKDDAEFMWKHAPECSTPGDVLEVCRGIHERAIQARMYSPSLRDQLVNRWQRLTDIAEHAADFGMPVKGAWGAGLPFSRSARAFNLTGFSYGCAA